MAGWIFTAEIFDQRQSRGRDLGRFLFPGVIKTPPHALPYLLDSGTERFVTGGKDGGSAVRCTVMSNLACQAPSGMRPCLSAAPSTKSSSLLPAMRPKYVTLTGSQDHCEFCKLLPLRDCLCSYPPLSCTCSKRSKILLRTLSNISRNPLRLKTALHRPSARERIRSLARYLNGPLETEVINDWWAGSEQNHYTVY